MCSPTIECQLIPHTVYFLSCFHSNILIIYFFSFMHLTFIEGFLDWPSRCFCKVKSSSESYLPPSMCIRPICVLTFMCTVSYLQTAKKVKHHPKLHNQKELIMAYYSLSDLRSVMQDKNSIYTLLYYRMQTYPTLLSFFLGSILIRYFKMFFVFPGHFQSLVVWEEKLALYKLSCCISSSV